MILKAWSQTCDSWKYDQESNQSARYEFISVWGTFVRREKREKYENKDYIIKEWLCVTNWFTCACIYIQIYLNTK